MRTIKRTTQFKSDFKRLLREKARRKFPEFYEEFESIIQKLADVGILKYLNGVPKHVNTALFV